MKKPKGVFILARIFKQVVWKRSGYGIFIELSFYIKPSLISCQLFFLISYCFCECHDKVANLLTSALVEVK